MDDGLTLEVLGGNAVQVRLGWTALAGSADPAISRRVPIRELDAPSPREWTVFRDSYVMSV